MKKYFALLALFPSLLMGAQEWIELSHKISDPFVKQYAQRANLSLFGSGGGMVHDIDLICLTFRGRQRLNLSEARKLYVDGVEDLLNRYNKSTFVRPYLHNFPFTIHNLSFKVIFEDRPGKFVPSNFIAGVLCINGIVYYLNEDHELGKLMDLHEESYEEALTIVHAERDRAKNSALANVDYRDPSLGEIGSVNHAFE